MHDTPTIRSSQPHIWLVRALVIAALIGLALIAHTPTHLVSALARLSGQTRLIDTATIRLSALGGWFWIAPLLLTIAVALRNRVSIVAAARPSIARREIGLAVVIALIAITIRAWPVLREPWIKPDYDEGVYLGGAWLLRDGALPYRDFVFPHLPGALLMLQPAAWLIGLWRDNATALQAARLTATLADGIGAGLIFLAARQLTTAPGAFLAALVYASDALAVEYSRGTRLEPLQAPWIVAGALLLLIALNSIANRRWIAIGAGALLAIGVTVKITGAIVPVAGLLTLLIERRWATLRDFAVGIAIGALGVCGWFALTSGDEIFRQTVLLQLQRSPTTRWDFWLWLLGDQWTAFTSLAAVLGAAGLGALLWRGRVASGWLFVTLWLSLALLLFSRTTDFYDHYYVKLLAPLALLASATPALLDRWARRAVAAAGLALILTPLWWGQAQHWNDVDRAATLRPTIAALAALPPGAGVLHLDPLPLVLSGRPIPRAPNGPYLLDVFLGDPYLRSSLNRRWPDVEQVRTLAANTVEYLLIDRADADRIDGVWRSFTWQALPNSRLLLCTRVDQAATLLRTDSQLELLRPESARIAQESGQRWLIQPLHWRAPETPAPDQALALHVVDQQGSAVAQLDVPINGGATWTPDDITTLEYRVPLPADLAPGTYRVMATVYSWADGQPIALHAADGGSTTQVALPPITIQ